MKGWRIAAWSREQGTGTITSEVGDLPFNACAAKVLDFAPGELVDAKLRAVRQGWEVVAVAPVSWRDDELPIVGSPLPASLEAALAEATRLLGIGRDLVLLDGHRDVLRMQIQSHDWPPPGMPPIATLELHDVEYLQIPTYSEDFVSVRAFPCRAWLNQRAALVSHWSIDPDDLDPDSYVLRFEPNLFVERPGFVVARSLTVVQPVL